MMPGVSGLPPVLLLHGLGGTGETLAPLARALESLGVQVVHPTLAEKDRRRAATDGTVLKFSLTDLLDEAKEHAAKLARDSGKPVVCGHSNGALLATVLAAEEDALHAVLLAPVPPPSVPAGVPVWLQKLFFALSFGPAWRSRTLHFDRRRHLDPDPPAQEVAGTLLPDSGCVLDEVLNLARAGRFDPKPPMKAPVTVLAGDRDRIVALSTARNIAARYHAPFHQVRDGGHWFPAERRFAGSIAEIITNAVLDGSSGMSGKENS